MANLFGANTIRRLAAEAMIENFEEKLSIITEWHNDYHHGSLLKDNETSREQAYNQNFFGKILGYKEKPGNIFTFEPKSSTNTGQMPDARIGFFDTINDVDKTVAVVELKGAAVSLDKGQKGHSNLSPVQQGFKYKPQYRGCDFVIVSNFFELRLYNDNMLDYESWTLDELVAPKDDFISFKVFHYLLSSKNFVSANGESNTKSLLLETRTQQETIGRKFYEDYRESRQELLKDLWLGNEFMRSNPELAIEKAQKLVDRIVFSCFAEDSGFIPEATLSKVLKESQDSSFGTVWSTLRAFFDAVDVGSEKLGIPVGFNGGLFAKDNDLDNLVISDAPLRNLLRLANYNFTDDLSVTILGHIFEQSITDLEDLRSEARSGKDLTKSSVSKRKKDGIFYTPDYVVRAIVDLSLGEYLRRLEQTCMLETGVSESLTDENFTKRQLAGYSKYLEKLREIKVIDPACGSGAFLVAAFDFLLSEHKRVHGILGPNLFQHESVIKPILQNNIFGVDLNEESVEITKLSLWLKSATREEKLTKLDENIRCGNSLVGDPAIAANKSFDWNEQFSDIMNQGGFDVVFGNPPYVQSHIMVKSNPIERDYISKKYVSAQGNWDLYVPFYQLAFDLLRPGGICSMIVPNKILIASYASKLREHISSNGSLISLVDVSAKGIFDVDVYPVITTCGKAIDQGPVSIQNDLSSKPESREIGKNDLHWGTLLSTGIERGDQAKTVRLDSLFDVFTSATVNESYLLRSEIAEGPNANAGRIVNTGTIDPYIHFWGIWPMKYLKLSFLHPIAPIHFWENTKTWHAKDKVIIAGMANTIEGCFSKGAELFPAIPTVVVTAKEESDLSAMAALGLVNSEPFRARFIDSNRLNAMAGGYITVTRNNIGECQIPSALPRKSDDLASMATLVYEAATELSSITVALKKLVESEYGSEAWTTRLKTWWDLDFAKFTKAIGTKLSVSQKNQLIGIYDDYIVRAHVQVNAMNKGQLNINELVKNLYAGTFD